MKEQVDRQVTLLLVKDGVNAFRGGNADVVAVVREAIEPLAVKRYNRALFPHGPENLTIKWPGGYLDWFISYPKHLAETCGTEAVANAHETCAVVALDNVAYLVIGPNGAWMRDRDERGWIVGEANRADAKLVKSILDLAFDALAKDLAERSLAGVAQQLREKSIGFGRFNKIADIAKEILGRK
jgi:hypothetical protein